MANMLQRKLAITFTIDVPQLERLTALAERERRPRSLIIREAIERELERYENGAATTFVGGREVEAVAVRRKTNRRR